MGLHFQNEGWLPPALNSNGCYLLAIMAIAQLHHEKYLSQESTLALVETYKAAGQVSPDYWVVTDTAPYAIISTIAHELGYPDHRGTEIGQIDRNGLTLWQAVYHARFNYAIQWGKLANGAEHKVLCDWRLREIYNPYPGREIVSTEKYTLYFYGPQADVKAIYER